MKRRLAVLAFLILLILPLSYGAKYNYSYYGGVIYSAPGMTFATFFDEQTLNNTRPNHVEEFKMEAPEDMKVYNNKIYITSKSHNIIEINSNFEVNNVYKEFPLNLDYKNSISEEKLASLKLDANGFLLLDSPNGIEINDNAIWVCDTGNRRIVKLNHAWEVIGVVSEVDDVIFTKEDNPLPFVPNKITVDSSDRMYVVVNQLYEGILELDVDGSFNRYTGVNPVALSPWDIFVRSLMTDEQLDQMSRTLPTSFNNVFMSENNFIYATANPTENTSDKTIQLINPKGKDVLRRNGYHNPGGDVQFLVNNNEYVVTGPSLLVDIAATNDGIYTVLDQKRSRLFTYDREGYLLYINGDEGTQSDKFSSEASAIAYFGDDLLVLDKRTRNVVVYKLTDFGRSVNNAVHLQENGRFEEAAKIWEDILILNTNYEIAYNGVGKYNLRQNDYEKAIENFSLGHNEYYYSKAYKEYRNNILKDAFGPIVITIVVLIGTYIAFKIIKRKKVKKDGA